MVLLKGNNKQAIKEPDIKQKKLNYKTITTTT